MGKPDAPEPPDYSGVAKASKQSARWSMKIAQKQLDWAKRQYKNDRPIYKRAINSFLDDMKETSQQAKEDREFYEANFQPMEKAMAEEAQGYDTAERRADAMSKASSGVAEQFDAARENAVQQLESYGIDPSSTRHAALDIGMRANQAAAQAAAASGAETRVEDTGRALRQNAVNVGRGYPGQIIGEYGVSGNMGNNAMQGASTKTTTGAQAQGTAPQYLGSANQAIGQWGNILSQGYQDQMAQYNANQQSSGLGSVLGLVGGMAGKYMFGADGGVIPDPNEESYGGPIHEDMSPSGGAETDDVPARLNAGEFVIPDDVVSWFGEKHFYNLIDKTAKERDEAKQRTGAIPEEGVAPIEEPQYQSA
jgi:hypothetical protein